MDEHGVATDAVRTDATGIIVEQRAQRRPVEVAGRAATVEDCHVCSSVSRVPVGCNGVIFACAAILRLCLPAVVAYFFSRNSLKCFATASAIDCSFLPPRCLFTE